MTEQEKPELKPRRPGAMTPINMEGSFISYPNDPISQAINAVAEKKQTLSLKTEKPESPA